MRPTIEQSPTDTPHGVIGIDSSDQRNRMGALGGLLVQSRSFLPISYFRHQIVGVAIRSLVPVTCENDPKSII